MFAEFGLPRKMVSSTGMNFLSDKFKLFSRYVNNEQAITLLCHHQSNRQVESYIKFVKHIIRNILIIVMMLNELYCR